MEQNTLFTILQAVFLNWDNEYIVNLHVKPGNQSLYAKRYSYPAITRWYTMKR